jgi:putative transposase
MGMQISCGFHTEVSEEDVVWAAATGVGASVSATGRTDGVPIEEGHLMIDHVHMLISIPPKMSVSAAMGFIKGKSAIHIARVYAGRRRSFVGQHFWARGYWVSTVGRDEEAVRRYIREQEKEDLRLDQLELKPL